MYLRGSKWSMSKRRKPLNLFRIMFLAGVVGIAIYVNQVIVPTVPPIGIPTLTPTRDPESYITDAEQLFKQGKLSQAIEAYSQVVHARPKDAASYIAMARAQVWSGKYLDAQKSAEYALLLNPNNSTAHAVRAWALDFQHDYLAAETSIKRALELDPNNALAHAYYAELLADQYGSNTGPFDALPIAIEESKTALALGPTLLEAHRARGYILYMTQNYESAIAEYQAAIAINKNIEDLQLNLGLNYRALGVNDKAVEAFSSASALNPSDPLPNVYISRVYAGTGEYGKALQYAQQAVQIAPADTSFHGNLGVMFYRNFKYPEAIQELAFVAKGGTLEDGTVLSPLALVDSQRIAEYYFIYGLALAKLQPPRCGEALPLAQQILAKLPGDETSVFNANEIIRLCAEAAQTTPVPAGSAETPESLLTPGETATITPAP
jgi:tetratricopeptide (TPR) repeat protein